MLTLDAENWDEVMADPDPLYVPPIQMAASPIQRTETLVRSYCERHRVYLRRTMTERARAHTAMNLTSCIAALTRRVCHARLMVEFYAPWCVPSYAYK